MNPSQGRFTATALVLVAAASAAEAGRPTPTPSPTPLYHTVELLPAPGTTSYLVEDRGDLSDQDSSSRFAGQVINGTWLERDSCGLTQAAIWDLTGAATLSGVEATLLPQPQAGRPSEVWGISEQGTFVCGWTMAELPPTGCSYNYAPAVWVAGTDGWSVELPPACSTLSPALGSGIVRAMNEGGLAAGRCNSEGHSFDRVPVLWRRTGDPAAWSLTPLPLPDGFDLGEAWGISSGGLVIGEVWPAGALHRAAIWRCDLSGCPVELLPNTVDTTTYVRTTAYGVNAAGTKITGFGFPLDGESRVLAWRYDQEVADWILEQVEPGRSLSYDIADVGTDGTATVVGQLSVTEGARAHRWIWSGSAWVGQRLDVVDDSPIDSTMQNAKRVNSSGIIQVMGSYLFRKRTRFANYVLLPR